MLPPRWTSARTLNGIASGLGGISPVRVVFWVIWRLTQIRE